MKKNVKILAPEEIFLGSLSAVWHYSLRSVLLRYWRTDELSSKRTAVFPMIKNDVSCPECNAGFRRIELVSRRSEPGEYRCPICDTPLETFDGSTQVAYRLTVPPAG